LTRMCTRTVSPGRNIGVRDAGFLSSIAAIIRVLLTP
jgi:hypothetical protein